MRKYYFVRHGEIGREPDPLLTVKGLKQASWAGLQLPKGVPIYSSPIMRAKQTASIISGITGSTIVLDERLRERIDYNEVEGVGYKEYRELIDRSNADPDFELPNGQSVRRKGQEVLSLVQELSYADVSIFVAHAGTILDFARALYAESELSVWQSFRTPYASITCFHGEAGSLVINNQVFCPYVGVRRLG